MSRLLHHFLPVFSFGLALDEKVTANQASEAAAAVTARARELIDRAKSAALADGKRPEQADGAAFAVVAGCAAMCPMWLRFSNRQMATPSRWWPGSTRSWRATPPT